MKLIEAARNVKRPKVRADWQYEAPIEDMAQEFGIYSFWDYAEELDARCASYPILTWYCTDEVVGYFAIYLDDELVCVSYKNARKDSAKYSWVSQETYDKTEKAFRKAYKPDIDVTFLSEEEEITEFYSCDVSSLIKQDGFYEEQPVKLRAVFSWWLAKSTPVEMRDTMPVYNVKVERGDERDDCVLVILADGTEKIIPSSEFKIRINVNT